METKTPINYTKMINNCDKNPTINNISYPATNVNKTCINDEFSNSSCVTTIEMTIRESMETIPTATIADNQYKDQINYEMINEISDCESSLISCCSDNEMEYDDIENVFDHDSDGEQDTEIFYNSTNESEDYQSEKVNEKQTVEQTINNNNNNNNTVVDDCDLSKLYLNDVEIDSKEEKQTVTELVNVAEKDKVMQAEQGKILRVAFGVILRLIFPLANGVVQGIKGIRDVRFLKVIRSIASRRQALTNLFAFAANTISLNLSSVQVSHRIEPILKLLKIHKSSDGIESLPDSPTEPHAAVALTPPTTPNTTAPLFSPLLKEPRYSLPNFQTNVKRLSIEENEAPKCCSLNILVQPPEGQSIRADIVFIHGLHGSVPNTWKQGLWENERRPVEFQRPPKPPVRPPKRPRHSRSNAVHPAHHKKIARFAHTDIHPRFPLEKDLNDETDDDSFSFICGELKDVQICDGIEYSFPTYRLRMNDNGRLLQAEYDSNSQKDSQSNKNNNNNSTENAEDVKADNKPSAPNEQNYSKCWPGDWLPIDCPGVRVIALNYTTDQHLWRPLWRKKEPRSNLIQRAREMTELLIKHRVGYGHPIVWVGHSKGGLYIKQIIVDAWESGRPAAAPFWRSARGVFFYSVPHRGSHLASIKAPLLLRSVELIDIEKNNKYLLDLHRRFAGLYNLGHLKIEVFSFVETALTSMSVLYLRIIGVDSADPGIGDVCGIRLDHREICKPRSRECILYKKLVDMINKVC